MQTKTKKKGFTLVELVVVVAVIAVLSAILIPTIGCFVEDAKETSDMTTVKTLNTVLVRNEAENGKPSSYSEVLDIVSENGYRLEKLTPLSTGHILWDSKNNRFLLKDKDGKDVYRDNTTVAADKVDLWKIVTPETGLSADYSNYLVVGDYSGLEKNGVLEFSTGFDIGDNTNITKVKYANTGDGQTVSIYTNSYNVDLTVDAANDNVDHYDELGNLLIENVKGQSYHEHGKVKSVRIKNGHFIAEPGCELGSFEVIDGGNATYNNDNAVIWNAPEYEWGEGYLTCTATRTSKDGTKTETETVEVVVEKVEPTTTTEGSVTYTATFKNPAFGSRSQTEVLPKELSKEETLVNSMNEAVSGYTGESIMKALVYMANKETNVSVSNLVHSDSAKTFAYDSVNHKFYIVNAADGTVLYPENVTADNANLVYVVNDNNIISKNMTKIYVNNYDSIEQGLFKSLKTSLKHIEVGGKVKGILSQSDYQAKYGCFYEFTKLENVYIGSQVKKLAYASFAKTSNVKYVYYNANAETIENNINGYYPFGLAGSDQSPVELEIGKDVRSVPALFIYQTASEVYVNKVVFESGSICETIEGLAFQHFKIEEIVLPKTLKRINGYGSSTAAFHSCSNLKVMKWSGNEITMITKTYYTDGKWVDETTSFIKGGTSKNGLEEFQAHMRGAGTYSTAKNLVIELIEE